MPQRSFVQLNAKQNIFKSERKVSIAQQKKYSNNLI